MALPHSIHETIQSAKDDVDCDTQMGIVKISVKISFPVMPRFERHTVLAQLPRPHQRRVEGTVVKFGRGRPRKNEVRPVRQKPIVEGQRGRPADLFMSCGPMSMWGVSVDNIKL